MMTLILLIVGSALGAFLVCALLGLIHRTLGYRRADALTAAAFAAFAGLFFLIDPLPKTVGKENLYLAFAAAGALLAFTGLKLDERFKSPWAALIAVPVLTAALASALHLSVHFTDDSDYRPRRARPAGALSRALSHARALRRKR